MKFININLIIILLYSFYSCNTTEPPPNDSSVTLKLEDVSCTEAWLQLSTTNIQLPTAIDLIQNDNTRETINLATADTILYIDSLLPNQNYKFKISGIQSNEITAATLDTTSNDFTWQTFTFGGDDATSQLNDVSILNENDIWAVGSIYKADTTALGYTFYNAVHWDGNEWQLKRIPYQFNGHDNYGSFNAIFTFNENDIWFGTNIHWDGQQFEQPDVSQLLGWIANKMWGSDNNNLYAVGNGGHIAHFHNGQWSKIESGTTLYLDDIYGNENGDVYVCGGNLSTGQGIVLKINNNNTVTKIIDSYYYGTGFDSTKMFTENLYGPLLGIWVSPNGTVYTVGNLIYRYYQGIWGYAKGIEYNYLDAGFFTGRGGCWDISGKESNDFIFVGERNTIRYFNGIRALQIGEPFSYTSEYQWYSVDYKKNIAVTVGKKGGYAAVIVFRDGK